MEKKVYKSQIKNIAQSSQKLRLVIDVVRGRKVEEALQLLSVLNKKGARFVEKALNSAVANAKNIDGVTSEKLYISKITVDEATVFKRVRFASRGRVSTLHKRRSNLNIELSIK